MKPIRIIGGMIMLLPVSPSEFDRYLRNSIRDFAAEKVRAGSWKAKEASKLARETFNRLLPDGLDTENQHLYSIKDTENGKQVGFIWVGVKDRSPVPGAWIWDISIFEEHRRKGYATEALHALERVLSSMGEERVSLHVFGHNTPALALYEKYGFSITDISMTKTVEP